MCDVIKSNFVELYPEIEANFKKALFITIDCEFTALHTDEFKGGLFDTANQRYKNLVRNLEKSIPLQIGLTAFKYDPNDLNFIATSYRFYVFPESIGEFDVTFNCQSSAFQFLASHNFDFNKAIYSGIPFIRNVVNEKLQQLRRNNIFYDYCRVHYESYNFTYLKNILVDIEIWYYKKKQIYEISIDNIGCKSPCVAYLLRKLIQERFFHMVWVFEKDGKIYVKRVTKHEYENLSRKICMEEELLDTLLGFTKVYNLLVSLKKPIVGHNVLNDILLIINSFDCPLPSTYKSFKKFVTNKFPAIYDTKTISFELLNKLPKDMKFYNNSLEELVEYFKSDKGKRLVYKSPKIIGNDNLFSSDKGIFHDAAWDSYCTGYCFIQMAHYFLQNRFASQNRNIIHSSEYLTTLSSYKNKLNLIRASISYLNLSGPDPKSQRPPHLIIRTNNQQPVDDFKIRVLLCNYGAIDIRPHSSDSCCAIIATGNHRCAQTILENFKHTDFQIQQYNPLKHSPLVKQTIWSVAIISGSVAALYLYSNFLKTSIVI